MNNPEIQVIQHGIFYAQETEECPECSMPSIEKKRQTNQPKVNTYILTITYRCIYCDCQYTKTLTKKI